MLAKRSSRPPKAKVRPADVMELLSAEYGPWEWKPRYDAASELVYTVLSQHTSDVNSGRAFRNLMETFGSLEEIVAAEVDDIERSIRMAGLSRIKAPRIKGVLEQMLERAGSFDLSFLREMPLDEAKAWLKELNGIGPKSAAVILCFSLGMPAMPVDTHIFRVSKRLGFIGPKVNAEKAHEVLEPMVAPEDVYAFHLNLINHGRQVCKALRPQCERCVLAWGCPSRDEFLPQGKATRTKPKKRRGGSRTARAGQ